LILSDNSDIFLKIGLHQQDLILQGCKFAFGTIEISLGEASWKEP